ARAGGEAPSSGSASAMARADGSIEGRSIEGELPGSQDLRDSRSRTWVSATNELRGLHGLFEQALDQQLRNLDGIREPLFVDELETLGRQVVLVVAEVRKAGRRDALLVEGGRVHSGSRRPHAQRLAVT